MTINRSFLRIGFVVLLFLLLIDYTAVFSLMTNNDLYEEKEEIFKNSRVSFGYNATLINKSDLNMNCWVILKDQGDYDVTWKGISINFTARDLDEQYKETAVNEILAMESRIEKLLTMKTPYDDLTEDDLELKITFSFYEVNSDTEIVEFAFTHNWTSNASFIGFIIPVLVVLSIIKRRSNSRK